MDHAVVGFEMLGDPVLGGDFITLQDGLNVLYGLNGAGKTRLLTGMKNALLGIGSDIRIGLIARVNEPTEADVAFDSGLHVYAGRDVRASGAGLLVALAEERAGRNERDQSANVSSDETFSLMTAFDIVRDHLREELDPGFPDDPVEISTEELEFEVLSDRLFLLVPDGTSGSPGWQAWPVADRRGPVIAQWEQRWANTDDPSLDEDEREDLVDRLSNVALRGAASAGIGATSRQDFPGSQMWTRDGDPIYSRSFVFLSHYTNSGMTPSITLRGPIDLGIDVIATEGDAEELTLEFLGDTAIRAAEKSLGLPRYFDTSPHLARQNLRQALRDANDGEVEEASTAIDQVVGTIAADLSGLVSQYVGRVLLDPPIASIDFTPSVFRFTSPAARWRFRASADAPAVSLDQLSTAERRWASLAILDAIAQLERSAQFRDAALLRQVLLIVDEPEAALHRAAEARAAEFLQQWASDPRHLAVVATHSPELLDLPDASLIEIAKDKTAAPTSQVRRLDLADRDALSRLGLRPSDLLRWTRIFLLVEGLHDKVILDGYFGDRVREARIDIVPLRGASKLPNTVDSRVLFTFTDATVVALLDNIASDSVQECWERAQSVRLIEGIDAAKTVVLEGITNQAEESRFLREWLTSALDKGLESRLMPIGLSAKDVIEYLPVSAVVPGATSWESLRREHQGEREAKPGTPGYIKNAPKDFKKWLDLRKGIGITEDLIRQAQESTLEPPQELERLMKTLEAVSSQPRVNVTLD